MKQTLLILFTLFAVLACKKKNTAKPDTIPKPAPGTYICTGESYTSFETYCRDAFEPVTITYVSDSVIGVGNSVENLIYDTSSSTADEIHFHYATYRSYRGLIYFPKTRHIIFSSSASASMGSASTSLSDSLYKPEPLLHSYANEIEGSHAFTGIYYDSLYPPAPTYDSTANLNTNITFTVINDSTIQFDKQFVYMGITDSVLHYRSTDPINHEIIWQTYHTLNRTSTIRYNYLTHAINFKQFFWTVGATKAAILNTP